MQTAISLDVYMGYFAAEHGADAALRNRTQYLDRFLGWLGEKAISPATLMDYRTSLSAPSLVKTRHCGDTLAMATRNRHLTAVKSYLNWLRRRGELALSKDQLSESLAAYRVPMREPEIFSKQEIYKLLEASMLGRKSRHRPLGAWLVLALTLGCRPGELANINAADVGKDEVLIFAGKTKRQRRVPLHDTKMAPVLLGLLVKNQTKIVGDVSYATFANLCDRAGIPRKPIKTLRATAIAYAASSGKVPEYLLAARFGHSQEISTKYYRQPIQGITGDSFEEWYGCPAAFTAVTNDCQRQIKKGE